MAGRKIDKIKANTSGLFDGMKEQKEEKQMVKVKVEQGPIKVPQPTPTQPTMIFSNTTPEPPQKPKETPVSIWFNKDVKRRLKASSTATGQSVSKLVNTAVEQYLSTLDLNEDQLIIYNTVMRMSNK